MNQLPKPSPFFPDARARLTRALGYDPGEKLDDVTLMYLAYIKITALEGEVEDLEKLTHPPKGKPK